MFPILLKQHNNLLSIIITNRKVVVFASPFQPPQSSLSWEFDSVLNVDLVYTGFPWSHFHTVSFSSQQSKQSSSRDGFVWFVSKITIGRLLQNWVVRRVINYKRANQDFWITSETWLKATRIQHEQNFDLMSYLFEYPTSLPASQFFTIHYSARLLHVSAFQ